MAPRVLELVFVLHALLEQVEDPVMLGPRLLHFLAQQLVLEPESLRLLAGTVQALLDHPILHAVAGGLGPDACRGAIALHRPGHAHRACLIVSGTSDRYTIWAGHEPLPSARRGASRGRSGAGHARARREALGRVRLSEQEPDLVGHDRRREEEALSRLAAGLP